jgi:hypothetical protein
VAEQYTTRASGQSVCVFWQMTAVCDDLPLLGGPDPLETA